MKTDDFLYRSRPFQSIKLWEKVSENDWYDARWQIKNSIRNVDQLKEVIQLSPYQEYEINRTVSIMKSEGKDPLRISPYYASLMHEDPFFPAWPHNLISRKKIDPIFWQSVPTPANLLFPDAGPEGAMKEADRSYGAAYQRYPNRVALLVAPNTSCASYCVHCQRAKTLDRSNQIHKKQLDKGLFYIGYNKNINEVLVTGGDPLMIARDRLRYILEELSKIEHLRVIRMATRVPVVLPMAVDHELLEMIKTASNQHNKGIRKYVYFVTHINHFQEITNDLAEAVNRINDHGFTVRNQTVLLNHVNDNYKILAETFRRMFWIGVHPYYLLQCHKEKGILHFIVPIQVGKIYMKHLQGWISGITVPRYAANIEGGGGKVLLMPSGHDTLNVQVDIDSKISESYATISTWDHKKIVNYEALGRTTREEFDHAVKIMDKFIRRKGVFLPKLIIIDEKGNHLETTNRTNLPTFEKTKKSHLLGYECAITGMPVTNPNEIKTLLDTEFENSPFSSPQPPFSVSDT